MEINEKAIAFIILKISDCYVNFCMKKIKKLKVPDGFDIEVVICEYHGNIILSYQKGMKKSNAKYKIYVAPYLEILYSDILNVFIKIFTTNKNIGMIGLLGTETLSTTGKINLSANLYGGIKYRNDKDSYCKKSKYYYKDVLVFSDHLLVTQYDVNWRIDLLDGTDCWGISQAVEFRRRGYRVVVPRQEDYWILMDKTNDVDDAATKTILNEYYKDIYPLVSVIIPSYRTEFLRISLDSVVNQTYKNLDIFISDDSSSDETYRMLSEIEDDRIHFVCHNDFDAFSNWDVCFRYNNPKAEYVKWLMDDDVLDVDCIARMVEYFQYFSNVTLVTSARKLIDKNGVILPDIPMVEKIVNETTLFNGVVFADAMLMNIANSIGELSTAMCRKNAMYRGYMLGFDGEYPDYYFMGDIMTWIYLLSKGDLIYISDVLSYFRKHDNQGSNIDAVHFSSYISWMRCIIWAKEQGGMLKDKGYFEKCVNNWTFNVEKSLSNAALDESSNSLKDLIEILESVKKGEYIDIEEYIKYQLG